MYSAAGIVHLPWDFVYVLVTAWLLWITLVSQVLIKQAKFLEQVYISFIQLLYWPPEHCRHSSDVGARLWRRLIYRDADRTAVCFQNVLGSYSNLPWAQSLPLRERDKGRTTKFKERTERTWSGSKEQCRRRKTKTVRASTSPSATWWTTVSRSKYKIY